MATTTPQVCNLIFERAGVFMLRKRSADGTLSTNPADIYVSNRPIVKSITTTTGKESYDIETGNSIYPADTRATKVNGTVAVVLNSYDRQLHRFATGMLYEENTENASVKIVGAEYTVDTTGKVTLPYKVVANSEIFIKDYSTNMPIEKTETTATEGQFTFADNVITFHESMKGKKVTITYEAESNATSTDYLGATPVDNTYEMTIFSEIANLKGALGTQTETVVFDSVKFDGDISAPPKQLQAGDYTVNLKIVEATGDKVVKYTYSNKDELKKFIPLSS